MPTPDEGGCRQAPYDLLASVYNRHFGSYAERLAPILSRLLLDRLPPGARLVDLCCGTGQLAAILTRRGFRVVGVDESREMLRFAGRNAPGAELIRADAAAFRLEEPAQAVVSTFDSVNHFLQPDKLGAVFHNVLRNLAGGGVFVFDMNMEDGFRARWRGEWEGVDAGRRYRIRAVYDEASRLGSNVVTVQHAGRRSTWNIRERCYSLDEVLERLAQAGFEETTTYDAERELDLFGAVGRTLFVCRKPRSIGRRGTAVPQAGRGGWPARRRSVARCRKDAVYPAPAAERELGAASRRLEAIGEVLCTLPEPVYEQLGASASRLCWFAPGDTVLGQVRGVPEAERGADGPARLIYLSPQLERQRPAIVFVCVAHEIAHVVLGHRLKDLDPSAYERQESEVRGALVDWGYGEVMHRAQSELLS